MQKPEKISFPWTAESECPCGCRRRMKECCFVDKTTIPASPAWNLHPPGPVTGLCNSRCYLGFTEDCSEKISKEHYVSKGVLGGFSSIDVTGVPWHRTGETRRYDKESLVSYILCQRHNQALSPLDKAAQHAAERIWRALHHCLRRSVSKRTSYELIHGELLELWALKTLLGLYHAKIAATDGETLKDRFSFNEQLIQEAFFGRGLARPQGLFVVGITDSSLTSKIGAALQFAPLSNHDSENLSGVRVSIFGLGFDFLFDLTGVTQEFITAMPFHRPVMLELHGPRRKSRIVMTQKRLASSGSRVAIKISQTSTHGKATMSY